MAFLNSKRLHLSAGFPEGQVRSFGPLHPGEWRKPAGQWALVGAVGIVLGLAILGAGVLPSKYAPFLLAAVVCPLVLLIVGDVKRFFLALLILDIPLQIDTHLDYHLDAAALGAIGGWNISVTTLCLMVLYAIWFVEILTKKAPKTRPLFPTSLPLALYVAVAALSVFVAIDPQLTWFEVFLFAQIFLMYVYIVNAVRTRQDLIFVVTFLLGGLALESLIMLGPSVGLRINLPGLKERVDAAKGYGGPSFRLGGTIGSPNTAASYLSLLLAPALSVLLTRLGVFYKALAVVAFGLGGTALLLTFSRGGWIAAALSLSILCIFAWHRGWLSPAIPVIAAVIALMMTIVFQDLILARLSADDRGAAYSRIPLMEMAFNMIKDHPVFGVGSNNYAAILKEYVTPEFSGDFIYTVHNKYLIVWSETGLPGLFAFIGFLLMTVRRGWQGWVIKDRLLSALALGFTAGVIGQMAHMFVDLFKSRPQVQLLWFVAAVIVAIYFMSREEPEPVAGTEE